MAGHDTFQHDPLLLLRQSIALESPVVPTRSEDVQSISSDDLNLAMATHLRFVSPAELSVPLTAPTRFISSDKPVDMRSIYFAWLKREVAIPEYNASALTLNAELASAGGAGGKVQNLAFVERLDLITWLEGATEESEYIRPLAPSVSSSAQATVGVAGSIASAAVGAVSRQSRPTDSRLQGIYSGERSMGDRNSILRGVKPTV